MKILQVLVLTILLGGLSSIVEAQACCLYSFRLKVSDSNGKILDNARVEFFGRNLNYNSDLKAYNFRILTGCSSKLTGLLKVKVGGFDDFEKEIEVKGNFYSFELKLNAKDSKQPAIFEQLAVIKGNVKDANDAVIPNTRVILTDENGKRTETLTNENGYFRLDVQSGKYSLEFIGTAGFRAKKYENFELTKGYKNLDVVLEVRPCDDCELMIQPAPVKENKKP